MRMQMMRKLRCLAWFPCLLAFLLLPGAVHAKEYACDVTIPATVQVSGDRIPSGEVYEVVMEAITKDAPVAEHDTEGAEQWNGFLWTDPLYSTRRLSV